MALLDHLGTKEKLDQRVFQEQMVFLALMVPLELKETEETPVQRVYQDLRVFPVHLDQKGQLEFLGKEGIRERVVLWGRPANQVLKANRDHKDLKETKERRDPLGREDRKVTEASQVYKAIQEMMERREIQVTEGLLDQVDKEVLQGQLDLQVKKVNQVFLDQWAHLDLVGVLEISVQRVPKVNLAHLVHLVLLDLLEVMMMISITARLSPRLQPLYFQSITRMKLSLLMAPVSFT